jgi:hypothetical protein
MGKDEAERQDGTWNCKKPVRKDIPAYKMLKPLETKQDKLP